MLGAPMKACSLARRIGLDGICPESAACAFWETMSTGSEGRCGVERLGLDHLDPAVAAFLLKRRGCDLSGDGLQAWPHLPGF